MFLILVELTIASSDSILLYSLFLVVQISLYTFVSPSGHSCHVCVWVALDQMTVSRTGYIGRRAISSWFSVHENTALLGIQAFWVDDDHFPAYQNFWIRLPSRFPYSCIWNIEQFWKWFHMIRIAFCCTGASNCPCRRADCGAVIFCSWSVVVRKYGSSPLLWFIPWPENVHFYRMSYGSEVLNEGLLLIDKRKKLIKIYILKNVIKTKASQRPLLSWIEYSQLSRTFVRSLKRWLTSGTTEPTLMFI